MPKVCEDVKNLIFTACNTDDQPQAWFCRSRVQYSQAIEKLIQSKSQNHSNPSWFTFRAQAETEHQVESLPEPMQKLEIKLVVFESTLIQIDSTFDSVVWLPTRFHTNSVS
jgi:hypothetical protein